MDARLRDYGLFIHNISKGGSKIYDMYYFKTQLNKQRVSKFEIFEYDDFD